MHQNEIVGTWSLVSYSAKGPDGQEFPPWGENPLGQLVYTADGYMSVILTRTGRPKFASSELLGGTPEEIKQAFEGMEAYAGAYEINLSEGHITHHTDVCRFPNWEGGSQLRYFSIQNDLLTLVSPPMLANDIEWKLTLVWRRKR